MAWLIVGVAEIWGNETLIIAYWVALSELELGNIGGLLGQECRIEIMQALKNPALSEVWKLMYSTGSNGRGYQDSFLMFITVRVLIWNCSATARIVSPSSRDFLTAWRSIDLPLPRPVIRPAALAA